MGIARGEASRAFHAEIHFGHGLLLLSALVVKSRDSRLLKGLADGSSAHRGVHLRSNVGLPGHVEHMADMRQVDQRDIVCTLNRTLKVVIRRSKERTPAGTVES